MKLITANKLNRLWTQGILPALGLKVDSSNVLKTTEEVTANTNPDNLPSAVVVDELIDNLKTSFQDGVDTLYNKCKSCGVTPADKTPTAIVNAIQSIYTNRYNSGRTQGQNDVKGNPGAYGVQTDVKHTVTITVKGNCGGDSRVNMGAEAHVSIDGGASTMYKSSGYVSPGEYTPARVVNLTV